MQVQRARWSAEAVTFSDSKLPIVKLHAHYCDICCGIISSVPLYYALILPKRMRMVLICLLVSKSRTLQVSHRLFELTNTLKSTFIPSKDKQRLGHNFAAAMVIAGILYILAYVLIKLPQLIVSLPPRFLLLVSPQNFLLLRSLELR